MAWVGPLFVKIEENCVKHIIILIVKPCTWSFQTPGSSSHKIHTHIPIQFCLTGAKIPDHYTGGYLIISLPSDTNATFHATLESHQSDLP